MLKKHGFELRGTLTMDHMAKEFGIGLLRLYHWIPQFDPVCAGVTQLLFLFCPRIAALWMLFA